jgi:hypothetical protein
MSQLSIHQKEHRKKIRNRRLLKVGVVLFLVLAVFFGLVFVSRMSRFRIGTIELSGQTLVSPDEVVSASGDFLSGYYFGLFPRNNFFIFPNAALKNFLKEKFKRIDTIQTHLSGFKKLEIVITERKQQALWCDGSPETVSALKTQNILSASTSPNTPTSINVAEKCYFLDDNGLIFSEAPNFSGNAYFKYYGGVTGRPDAEIASALSSFESDTNPIGQTYLATTTVFQDINSFVQSVGQTSLAPISVSAESDGGFTMFLAGGGKIYFNLSQPLSKTADNLKVLLETLQTSSSTSISNIDYIDLRFGDKLYYKMK